MAQRLWHINARGEKLKRSTQLFFARIKKDYKPQKLESTSNRLHKEVFAHTDCTKCANCCKKGTPALSYPDMHRLRKYLGGISLKDFKKKYIVKDEVDDMVWKKLPCVFLGEDNRCTVYEARPSNCRQYPHTQRTNFIEKMEVTVDNIAICPAVYEIVKRMREAL